MGKLGLKNTRNSGKHGLDESGSLIPRKLLGTLEYEVMQCMWEAGEATGHNVATVLNKKRPIAYTTITTVMGHLVDKGLLTRNSEGKRYLYTVAQTKEEFLRSTSQNMVTGFSMISESWQSPSSGEKSGSLIWKVGKHC